jgi:hypothetical protein
MPEPGEDERYGTEANVTHQVRRRRLDLAGLGKHMIPAAARRRAAESMRQVAAKVRLQRRSLLEERG